MEESLEELKMELEKNLEGYKRMVEQQEQFIQSAGLQHAFQEFLRSAVHTEEPEARGKEAHVETDIAKEHEAYQEDKGENVQAEQKHVKRPKSL